MKVSNVIYKGVHGTSITEDSIKLMCSQSISCSDIVLSDINIVSANSGKPTHAFCSNAYGTNSLSNPLVNCLSIPLTYEGCHPPENCLPPSQSTKFLDFHNVYLFFLSFLLCFSFLNPLWRQEAWDQACRNDKFCVWQLQGIVVFVVGQQNDMTLDVQI